MKQNEHNWDMEIAKDMHAKPHEWCVEVYRRDTEMYKLASEHFRQDLREFWSRTGMYILSQAFLFAAFAALAAQSRPLVSNKVAPTDMHDVIFEITLGAIGAVVAFNGFLAAKASAGWIQKWRNQMLVLDEKIDRYHSYSLVEFSEPYSAREFGKAGFGSKVEGKTDSEWSVSRFLTKRYKSIMHFLADPIMLTVMVPFLFCVGWLIMTIVVFLAAFVPRSGLG